MEYEESEEDKKLHEEMEYVRSSLEAANEHGLQIEFIYWAILNAKNHPEWDVSDCCHHALLEWDI